MTPIMLASYSTGRTNSAKRSTPAPAPESSRPPSSMRTFAFKRSRFRSSVKSVYNSDSALEQDRPTSLDHQLPSRCRHHHSASPKVRPARRTTDLGYCSRSCPPPPTRTAITKRSPPTSSSAKTTSRSGCSASEKTYARRLSSGPNCAAICTVSESSRKEEPFFPFTRGVLMLLARVGD